jgi:hypothetical protein
MQEETLAEHEFPVPQQPHTKLEASEKRNFNMKKFIRQLPSLRF